MILWFPSTALERCRTQPGSPAFSSGARPRPQAALRPPSELPWRRRSMPGAGLAVSSPPAFIFPDYGVRGPDLCPEVLLAAALRDKVGADRCGAARRGRPAGPLTGRAAAAGPGWRCRAGAGQLPLPPAGARRAEPPVLPCRALAVPLHAPGCVAPALLLRAGRRSHPKNGGIAFC